jgi:hypothetical protein
MDVWRHVDQSDSQQQLSLPKFAIPNYDDQFDPYLAPAMSESYDTLTRPLNSMYLSLWMTKGIVKYTGELISDQIDQNDHKNPELTPMLKKNIE